MVQSLAGHGASRPSRRLSTPVALLLALYAFTFLYAAVSWLLGEVIVLPTLLIGFGLPILVYLALEYVMTPLIACAAGFYGRWSLRIAVLLGYPLVVLATLVFPVGNTKKSLPVPVPWLAAYQASKDEVFAIIGERIVWWSGLFLAFVVVGYASRLVTARLSPRRYVAVTVLTLACAGLAIDLARVPKRA